MGLKKKRLNFAISSFEIKTELNIRKLERIAGKINIKMKGKFHEMNFYKKNPIFVFDFDGIKTKKYCSSQFLMQIKTTSNIREIERIIEMIVSCLRFSAFFVFSVERNEGLFELGIFYRSTCCF